MVANGIAHFDVFGPEPEALHAFYARVFGWEIDANNPMKYGTVQREGNTNADGVGIGGGVGPGPEGYDGHVTFYVEVPDVEAALAKAGARVTRQRGDRRQRPPIGDGERQGWLRPGHR